MGAANRIIDLHVHVFPDFVHQHLSKVIPAGLLSEARVNSLRDRARSWYRPFSGMLHKAQPGFRFLPQSLRRGIDELISIAPLPALLFESTQRDLKSSMEEAGVERAVVVAQPPMLSNEQVLDLCRKDTSLIPAVYVPNGTLRPSVALKKFHSRGARLLKIHPAMDGEGARSSRYHSLLKSASELGITVILHTGRLHASLFYKDSSLSEASQFIPWFKQYSSVKFILNQMNFHEPATAIDLAEEFQNVFLDTAWQPAEVIGEAARRVGAEKILFASDWPFGGNNLSIGIRKIEECVDAGLLAESEAHLILGENAVKLLGLDGPGSEPASDAR